MYCTNCGQKLPDDSVFCVKCGARIVGSVAEPEHEIVRVTHDTVPNTTPPISQKNDSGTNFDKNLIGKIILFLFVVGGLFAFMYYSPIKRGDYFARIRFFRGEPVKVEKNLAVFQKEPLLVVDLYEYPDVVIVTEPADDRKGFNRVYGFVPVGKYEILDLTDMYKSILKAYSIDEEDDRLRMVMFSQPLQQNKEIPLQIKSAAIKTELKSDTTKKDASETVKQPEVAQNQANIGASAVPSQSTGNNYRNTDFFLPGSRRGRITGTNVNMRSGPGKDHSVIGPFGKGEIVVVIDIEMSKHSWLEIRRKNGDVGWVSGDYCELVEDPKIDYPKYTEAAWAIYEFHTAITKKDYKKAYNLLAPEEQKTSATPDQFGQGYSDVISSTVMETYPRSTDGNTVFVEYLLEAKDKTPSGISVKYYKAFADLHKINGEWKVGRTSVVGNGDFDRKTLL